MEQFIKNLARGAGAILREGFGTSFKVSTKTGPADFVTQFDLASEKYIIDRIAKKFPSHGVIGEESGYAHRGKKNFWIIDPLDGTHGFVKGIGQFAVSIAFVSDGKIKLAAVYDPLRDEMFSAVAGKGAKLNGKKIVVGSARDLELQTVAPLVRTTIEKTARKKIVSAIYNDIVFKHNMWLEKVSSCALSGAYVAAGRIDCMISKGLWPWDYSAAALLIKEAGGKVTDFQGKLFTWNKDEFVSGNGVIHKKILKLLR